MDILSEIHNYLIKDIIIHIIIPYTLDFCQKDGCDKIINNKSQNKKNDIRQTFYINVENQIIDNYNINFSKIFATHNSFMIGKFRKKILNGYNIDNLYKKNKKKINSYCYCCINIIIDAFVFNYFVNTISKLECEYSKHIDNFISIYGKEHYDNGMCINFGNFILFQK